MQAETTAKTPHKYLLLAADPDEGQWTILHQSSNPDEILDMIDKADPSLRIAINTADFITYDTREDG